MTVEDEKVQVRGLVEDAQELYEIAETGPERFRSRLRRLGDHSVARLPPVRVSIAASVLDVSEPTVRTWEKLGILVALSRKPRLVLDPRSVIDVLDVVRDLRKIGSDRNLTDAVYNRLADEKLLADPALLEGLAQMRRGETRVLWSRPDEDDVQTGR